LSSDQLVDLLDNSNDWYSRTARRILGDRQDGSVVPRLKKMIAENRGRLALQSLWALYVSGGFDDALAEKTLAHENPDVRAWTVRLLCDEKKVSEAIAPKLIELARREEAATVRMQLACSARRLPPAQALPIVRELLTHSQDVKDLYIPLLLWWAIEDKAVSGREEVMAMLKSPAVWSLPLVRDFVLEKLGRRYAADRTEENFGSCARLLTLAPSQSDSDIIVAGMEKGLAGAALTMMPPALKEPTAKLWASGQRTPMLVRLMLRLGLHEAQDEAVKLAVTSSAAKADRVAVIEILGQVGDASCEPALIGLLDSKQPKEVRNATITALQRFENPEVAQAVLARYPQMDRELRARTCSLLCGRVTWASALLDAVEAGKIERSNVSLDQVRQIVLHDDKTLTARVSKLWGAVQPSTSQEKQESAAHVMRVLRTGKGDPEKGKPLFMQSCGVCHILHKGGPGGNIGPNLRAYDRTDLNFLVPNIVDPSASIRPEFATYTLRTKDRRVLSGPLVESTPQSVTIEDGTARVTIPRSQISLLEASTMSRMPEKLLDVLTDQQIRDLFAYIASEK
jgi:putative heme-binding domain-containing protein